MSSAALAKVRLALRIRAAQGVIGRPRAMTEYADRPEDFIVEQLGIKRETLRWKLAEEYERCGCAECERRGNPGPHEWDGTEEPLLAILEALAAGERLVGVESGNGTGKSFLAACIILWFIACHDGARVFTFAPKEDQLTKYIWAEISRLWPRFQILFPTAKRTHLQILMYSGDQLWGAWGQAVGMRDGEEVSSKASGMHGAHMLIVTEETQGMDPRVIAANEATCTDPHNLRLALGNPNYPADQLHQLCVSPGAVHVRISAHDHPNVVCGRQVVPGATSRVKVEEAARKHGTKSRHYQTRIRGLCPDGGGPALPDLHHDVHLITLQELERMKEDRSLVTRFGSFDWGYGHRWSFGGYETFLEAETGRQLVVKLDTITGHRMSVYRIATEIRDRFADVHTWDYLVGGGDIFTDYNKARAPETVPTPTISEQFIEQGLHFTRANDRPGSRRDNLNNFREYTRWREQGEKDPESGEFGDGKPSFYLIDTEGNQDAFTQLQAMTTNPKKAEEPLKVNANPETGEGGDDTYDETAYALASRPYTPPKRKGPKSQRQIIQEQIERIRKGGEGEQQVRSEGRGEYEPTVVVVGNAEALKGIYG